MRRGLCVAAALAMAVGLTGTACSKSDSSSTAETTSASTSASAAAASADKLPGLVPTPANSQETYGPDGIANNGIHLKYKVGGAPSEVMNAYKAALQAKGWEVTTIVTSGGAGGGGGATYTGTHGDAYGVFDGGGFDTSTFINVCAWASKPAEPNCTR